VRSGSQERRGQASRRQRPTASSAWPAYHRAGIRALTGACKFGAVCSSLECTHGFWRANCCNREHHIKTGISYAKEQRIALGSPRKAVALPRLLGCDMVIVDRLPRRVGAGQTLGRPLLKILGTDDKLLALSGGHRLVLRVQFGDLLGCCRVERIEGSVQHRNRERNNRCRVRSYCLATGTRSGRHSPR
jgi:hypothetical protein